MYEKEVTLMKKYLNKIHKNRFNKKLLKALKEVKKMEKHPEKYKTYNNAEELFKDLDK